MSVIESYTAGVRARRWPGAGMLRRARARHEARRAAAHLRTLDEHLLRDIGLTRADIATLDG